jgi:hypothetical protein
MDGPPPFMLVFLTRSDVPCLPGIRKRCADDDMYLPRHIILVFPSHTLRVLSRPVLYKPIDFLSPCRILQFPAFVGNAARIASAS